MEIGTKIFLGVFKKHQRVRINAFAEFILVAFSHKLAWKKLKNRLYSVFTSTSSVFTKKEIKCLIQQAH